MSSFFRKIKEKLWLFRSLKAASLVVYIVVFCLLSYLFFLDDVNATIEDYYLQRGEEWTNNVIIIGLNTNDIQSLDKDPSQIIADTINKINDGSSKPAAISVDINLNSIKDDAYDTILEASKKCNNIIMPIDLAINDSFIILNYDKPKEKLKVESKYYPREDLLDYVDIAHNIKPVDDNGTIRHALFKVYDNDEIYESMAFMAYTKYCEKNNIKTYEPKHTKDETALIKYANIINQKEDYTCLNILDESFDTSIFENKIIFIGYVDQSLDNGYLTAIDYDKKIHSVIIDAQVTDALIRRDFAVTMPVYLQVILLVLAIFLIMYCMAKLKPYSRFATLVVYFLVIRLGVAILFGVGYLVYSLPHMCNLVISSIVASSLIYTLKNYEERVNFEHIFGRYIDVNIAQNLIQKEGKKSLKVVGEGTKKVAVLFADIRSFTTITETLSAEKLVTMLNMNLSIMSDCVEKHGGTLDKFIGDCAMAYWEDKDNGVNVVQRACLAAAEMQRRIKDLSRKIKEDMGIEIKVGIGINYGDAIVGNIGSVNRMNYTVVGDNVNIAARLEEKAEGGSILISGQAKNKIENCSKTTIVESVKLRGKEKSIDVYSLDEVYQEKVVEKKVIKKDKTYNSYSKKAYWAIILNFIIFIYQFIFNLNVIRTNGIYAISYFTVGLSLLSCLSSGLIIPYDLKRILKGTKDNIKPRIIDISMLTGLICNIQIFVAFLIYEVIPNGITAYLNTSWPGGLSLHLLIPILSLILYFILESRRDNSILDCVFAEIPIVCLLILFSIIANITHVDDNTKNLYEIFYSFPNNIICIIIQTIGAYLLSLLNNVLKLNERINRENSSLISTITKYFNKGKTINNTVRYKNIFLLIMNILIGILELRTTIKSYNAGGIDVYSNLSLIGLIVCVLCIISIPFYIVGIVGKIEMRNISLFKYISFTKTFGCLINFFTMFLLAISGDGIKVFFIEKWFADWTVYLLCPAIAYFIWRAENNRYLLWKCYLTVIPFLLILPISRFAIMNNGLAEVYAYEFENFYTFKTMSVVILGEVFVSTLIFFINDIVVKLNNSEIIDRVTLSVLGNRETIVKGNTDPSIYGINTECYVLRKGDYAIVVNAGSGILNAKSKLEGCKKVDIILPSKRFSSILGFLHLHNICQGAKIRIYSTYNIMAFMEKPFWPVNTISGTWVKAIPNTKIKLTSKVYAEFYEEEGNEDCVVKISSDESICFIGNVNTQQENLREYAKDCEVVVISGIKSIDKKCFFCVDSNISKLLISGYPATQWDIEITEAQKQAIEIFKDTIMVKEGDEFLI